MNALFELYGHSAELPENIFCTTTEWKDGTTRRVRRPPEEVKKLLEEYRDQLQERHPNWMLYICNDRRIQFIDRELIEKEIDEEVRWAEIYHSDDEYTNTKSVYLRSNRTSEDIWKFINGLFAIEYYDGFGRMELLGNIVFKDGSWLERWQYYGSEGWVRKSCPIEPDWDKLQKQDENTTIYDDCESQNDCQS